MRILVTNDDGVASPGISALGRALADAGHDLLVLAPTSDRSGASAAIGRLHRSDPMPVVRETWPELPDVPVYGIDAPPATAVYSACLGAFGSAPDLVAAGVNPGANTGHLVLHSGTVGAALTASVLGIPALAVSVQWADPPHFDTAAAVAAAAVDWVMDAAAGDDRPAPVLNVNAPDRALSELRGVRDGRLAPYGEVWVATAEPSRDDLRLDYQGRESNLPSDTDLALLREGYASVTRLIGVTEAPPADGPPPGPRSSPAAFIARALGLQ